ncbi:ABC transporter permease [Candidatus Saccharibacteria bacterium]|nr:ABC transporter permease [Candidatus Saccharibacteria bacterium]
MSKTRGPIARVMRFEIVRQLKKPSFWVSILLVPVLMGILFLVSFLAGSEAEKSSSAVDYGETKIAITDDAGVLPSSMPFVINGDEEYGKEMIKNGEADLYFYIPSDFAESKKAKLYHVSEGLELFNNDSAVLKAILAEVAASKVSSLDATMLTGEFEIEDNKMTASGEEENAIGKAIIPLVILVTFFLFVCLFGNRLLMTVIEEKENRISEMILTTISSKHLIIGKILSMMVLGAIQILSFLIPLFVLIFINRDNSIVGPIISMIEIEPVSIIINLVLFLFSVLLFAGFCSFVGTLVSTARDASSFLGPVIIGTVCPFYFMSAFFASSPSMIVGFLTFFPVSAPTAMMLRNACGNLSTVEFIVGLIEIIVLAIIMISLTIKMFQKNIVNFDSFKPKFLRRK